MRKRRKKSGLLRGLITLLLLLALFAGGGLLLINAELNKINRQPKASAVTVSTDTENTAVSEESAGTESDADFEYVSMVPADSKVTNILLIGQDRRPGEDRARSDSMILASINKRTGKITLISLMRDMYVEIPGYGKTKMNAAYAYGGMPLLDQTIENNFGIHIDGNVEVDFQAFMAVIDQIGGVDIELNAEEAEYLNVNNTGLVDGVTTEAWNLTAGVNTLTAQQALAYARTRYVGNSDWERTDRQRIVITAAANKFKNVGITSQMRSIDSILSILTTDMTNSDILNLGLSVLMSGMTLNSESYRIPAEGTYTSESIDGMSVLVPDLAANQSYLKEYIGG